MSDPRLSAARAGEVARDHGMMLAAIRKERAIVVDQVAFLTAMLKSDDLSATTDDAVDDLGMNYHDGGRWRGTVSRRLATKGTIDCVGAVASCRTSRHRGLLKLWRGKDRATVEAELARLRLWLAANPEPADDRRMTQPTLWPSGCDPNRKGPPDDYSGEPRA